MIKPEAQVDVPAPKVKIIIATISAAWWWYSGIHEEMVTCGVTVMKVKRLVVMLANRGL